MSDGIWCWYEPARERLRGPFRSPFAGLSHRRVTRVASRAMKHPSAHETASVLNARKRRLRFATKVGLGAGLFALVGFAVSRTDFSRDMHRLRVGMMGGAKGGSYSAMVDEVGSLAAKHHGVVTHVSSAGSRENILRLGAARRSGTCEVAFGLAQDGSDFSDGVGGRLELIGRLPKSESVLFLGRDADKRTSLTSLRGVRIGVGPQGSGSATLARQIFALDDLASLGVELDERPIAEQLTMAKANQLNLVMLVTDEDSPLVATAIRSGDLQLAGLSHLDVIARRIPRLRTGRVASGQYDAVAPLPQDDKRVLRIDTLVIGNGCASHSATIDMLTLLAQKFPDFVRHNQDTPNATGLELAPAAKAYVEHGGPELVDDFAPWLSDVMPPTNWAYAVMTVSVLFNVMGLAHRFRLWRIDASRVALETELSGLFGPHATLRDIERADGSAHPNVPATVGLLDGLVQRFEALAARSRKQSLSMLVPMGQELLYRHQESLIHEALAALRAFRERVCAAS